MANPKQAPSFFTRIHNAFTHGYRKIKNAVFEKWHHYQLGTVTVAASSATSTLRSTFEILPIITTILTFVAAAPLFHFLVPGFLFSPWIYIPAIIGVSGYAGYLKYHEIIERTKLDQQIIDNQQQQKAMQEVNDKLGQTVTTLQNSLKETQKSLGALQKQFAKRIGPLQDKPAAAKNDNENRVLRRSPRLARL